MKTSIETQDATLGMRGKLVLLFVLIKVFPLVIIVWVAWSQSSKLAEVLGIRYESLAELSRDSLSETGELAVNDAVAALDERARNEIERITTDTAKSIARFLDARDQDIKLAAALVPNQETYRSFVTHRQSKLMSKSVWQLAADGSGWVSLKDDSAGEQVSSTLDDNSKSFHSYPIDTRLVLENAPLYLEMTFIDLLGNERFKVTASERFTSELKDISVKANTYIKAESYFPALQKLKAGEIYVSDVIGAYVPSKVIGRFTPASAKKAGVEFEPHESAYAGKENPNGKRFQGIVRWAMPVVSSGKKIGYVSLALDHRHIMAFTDHIMPTEARYTNIPDASEGNYAFIWDDKGRNIAHPRHYFITGYDSETGEPQVPWLEQSVYDDWKSSGLSYVEFTQQASSFRDQRLGRKPAKELMKTGFRALDCRYLNFAPQCTGWFDLTEKGGSGSFAIFWSGIWKLTTAAPIPYFTGQYGNSPRGFGFVTVGANFDDFHLAAIASRQRIDKKIELIDKKIQEQAVEGRSVIVSNLREMAERLSASTVLMIVIVIIIAIWIASYLTKRITTLITGIALFKQGDRQYRFKTKAKDEMGSLADAFDEMADEVDSHLAQLEGEVKQRVETEQELRLVQEDLEERVTERTKELLIQVEERARAEEAVRHLADHDTLTGLANRRGFQYQLTAALKRVDSNGKKVALMLFDLDRFKEVNDTLGHGVGDELLCAVASHLRANIRDDDVVARLGGDEFAIVMTDLDKQEVVISTVLRIIETLSRPIQVADHMIRTGSSVGITVYPDDSGDSEQLILHADLAMYQAKDSGGQCYKFFEPLMHDEIMLKKQIENELHQALQEGEFCLYFQPRYDYRSGTVEGVEALIRWNHPTQGLLMPGAFLPIAQRCGLLPSVERWVLYEACHKALKWQSMGLQFGRLAINVCATELQQPDFYDRIQSALTYSGLSPSLLEIEITERAFIGQYEVVVENLQKLVDLNVSVALDDLGAENSSLQRLIECPIDVIKIDRFFVERIGEVKSEAVIAGILTMATVTGMSVVAEGVETESQLGFLRESGCDVIQGYLHARPMSSDKLEQYLKGE